MKRNRRKRDEDKAKQQGRKKEKKLPVLRGKLNGDLLTSKQNQTIYSFTIQETLFGMCVREHFKYSILMHTKWKNDFFDARYHST